MSSIYTLSKPVKIIRDDGLILHANKQTIKHPRFVLFDPAKHGENGEKMKEAYTRKISLSEMESIGTGRKIPKASSEGLELGEFCEDVELAVNALPPEPVKTRHKSRE